MHNLKYFWTILYSWPFSEISYIHFSNTYKATSWMEITFQNMGNNLGTQFQYLFRGKTMKETLISSPQMADEVVRSPNFLLVRSSSSHLLTDGRTDERPAQNCGSLAIPPRHRRKLTRTTCITCTLVVYLASSKQTSCIARRTSISCASRWCSSLGSSPMRS